MTATIAAHIDGPNFYASVQDQDGVLDYTKLCELVAREGDLQEIYYYTAVDRGANNGLNRLLYFLGRNGYEVVTKDVTKNQLGRIVKGNMDVDIAIGLVRTAQQVSDIYLLSGDGDFASAVQVAKDMGARVTIISSPRLVSAELVEVSDYYLDLADIWEDVKR